MEPQSTDDTRSRILNAAGPVFAHKGFQSSTVREICKAAKVNLASINYYFGDKQQLYIETVKQAQRKRLEQVPQPDWAQDTRAAEKLRGFIVVLITRMIGVEEAPWQTQLMMREILQPTKACEELVRDYFRPQFNVLLGILDELLPPETPSSQRHQLAFSIVGQCLYYRVADAVVGMLVENQERAQFYSAAQLGEHITQFTLAALGQTDPFPEQIKHQPITNSMGAATKKAAQKVNE